MKPEWRKAKLGEVASIVGGGTPKTSIPEYWEPKELKWVTAKDVSECPTSKIYDTERKISFLGLEKSSAKILPPLTTVLIARGATMGKVVMVAESMAMNQSCYGIVPKKGYDPRFLFYQMFSKFHQLRLMANGSVFDTVIGSGLSNLEVVVPSLPIQKRIADILGSLDDKIELNRRMNETLEQMAMALYKHWFVDFGPFQDGEFVETELGLIPKGWTIQQLSDLVTIQTSSVNPAKNEERLFLHYSIPAYDERMLPVLEQGLEIKSNKYLIRKNSVLVSKLNPETYRIWTVYAESSQYERICSTEFIVYEPKKEIAWAFLNAYFRDESFKNEFRSHAAGTTGSVKELLRVKL